MHEYIGCWVAAPLILLLLIIGVLGVFGPIELGVGTVTYVNHECSGIIYLDRLAPRYIIVVSDSSRYSDKRDNVISIKFLTGEK